MAKYYKPVFLIIFSYFGVNCALSSERNATIDSNNPFLVHVESELSCSQKMPDSLGKINNAWLIRGAAECFDFLSFYIFNKPKSFKTYNEKLIKTLALGDFLIKNMNSDGIWWVGQSKVIGDPNVNRFVLGALLDGLYWLRKTPEGEVKWLEWKAKVEKAVQFQYAAYEGKVEWDWGAKVRKRYPNQDVYCAVIMALASELFKEPKYQVLSEQMIQSIRQNQLPDGGFHYIGQENESPVYHALMLVMLGRYYTLTGSREVFEIIKKTANYWPQVMTAEGVAEGWSDVWLKQGWQLNETASALAIAASVSGDKRNKWLISQSIKHFPVNKSSIMSVYASPFWDKLPPRETPLPKEFVWQDRNINGIHGRKGNWYFGFTRRGVRNTFVGGLIGDALQPSKMNGIFRGAQIYVLKSDDVKSQLFLSDINDQSSVAVTDPIGGALCVNYDLQPSMISGLSDNVVPIHSWHVTQMWRTAKDGIMGVISIEAQTDMTVKSVAAKILLGPQTLTQLDSDTWASGQLKVRVYQNTGSVIRKQIATNPIYPSGQWNGLEMANSGEKYYKGDKLYWSAWIGPLVSKPPMRIGILPQHYGWTADWADGHKTSVVYNSSTESRVFRIPWSSIQSPQAWTGDRGAKKTIKYKHGFIYFTESPNECVLLDSSR